MSQSKPKPAVLGGAWEELAPIERGITHLAWRFALTRANRFRALCDDIAGDDPALAEWLAAIRPYLTDEVKVGGRAGCFRAVALFLKPLAWLRLSRVEIRGSLLLAGPVDDSTRPLLDEARAEGGICAVRSIALYRGKHRLWEDYDGGESWVMWLWPEEFEELNRRLAELSPTARLERMEEEPPPWPEGLSTVLLVGWC